MTDNHTGLPAVRILLQGLDHMLQLIDANITIIKGAQSLTIACVEFLDLILPSFDLAFRSWVACDINDPSVVVTKSLRIVQATQDLDNLCKGERQVQRPAKGR